jgi:hypothetical protein
MSETSTRELWDSIVAGTHEGVRNANQQGGLNLTFDRMTEGFRVSRQTPFLVVEVWFSEGNIHRRTQHRDNNGVTKHGLAQPLRISVKNLLSTTEGQSVTVEGLIQEIINCFRDSTGRYVA